MRPFLLLVTILVGAEILSECDAFDAETDLVYLGNDESEHSELLDARRLRGKLRDQDRFSNVPFENWNAINLFASYEGPDLQLDKTARTEGSITRVMLNCNDGETKLVCKNRILDSVPEGCLRFLHYLREVNTFAVEVKESCLDDLDDVQEDPVRETLHIPDSLEIHHGRELQSGQVVPYGIDLVRAREAWTQFGVKGENVRVCGEYL